MIIDPSIVSNTAAFKQLIAERQIAFFDFGCSNGGGTMWTQEASGKTGMGFDIAVDKLVKADQNDLLCCEYDLLTLPNEKLVDFTIIFHMLEHLYTIEQAAQFIQKAVQVSRHHVVIKQPFYDTDAALFHLGLKTYYSHWTGHRNQMTTPDFFFILDRLRRDKLIDNFLIGFKKPILSSSDPIIHPLGSPINCHDYDPKVHPPKEMGIVFDFPLFYEIQIAISVDGSETSPLWKHLAPEEVIYDSRKGNLNMSSSSPRVVAANIAAPALILQRREKNIHNPIKFFIRDDDFIERTDKFEKLERIAGVHSNVMLAAIPGGLKVTKSEAERIRENFVVVQHGYRHKSHALDEFKNEFPATRAKNLIENDLVVGKSILENWFGPGSANHFVAPWNRFAPEHYDVLEKHGFMSYQGLGSIGFYNNLPLVGYGINFTALFMDTKGDYDMMLKTAKQRIDAFLNEMRRRVTGEEFYFPINTHHLMMDDKQFIFLDKLINDFEDVFGFENGSANDALRYFSELKGRARPELLGE